uniref:Uncharacterized protein n=1 Tax=Rhizophora mucronata TaxID=61149 RepID=A0A2P2NXD2_RHIMU
MDMLGMDWEENASSCLKLWSKKV